MLFRIAVLSLLILSMDGFTQPNTAVYRYGDYTISLEKLAIKPIQQGQLFVSVHSKDLPLTRLLLVYKGQLINAQVRDINNDKKFEIILMFENTLENIRIFSWEKFKLTELDVKNHLDFLAVEIKSIAVETKKGEVIRIFKVLKSGSSHVVKQRFCFDKLQWCGKEE